jgi:hypothetical protein
MAHNIERKCSLLGGWNFHVDLGIPSRRPMKKNFVSLKSNFLELQTFALSDLKLGFGSATLVSILAFSVEIKYKSTHQVR